MLVKKLFYWGFREGRYRKLVLVECFGIIKILYFFCGSLELGEGVELVVVLGLFLWGGGGGGGWFMVREWLVGLDIDYVVVVMVCGGDNGWV